MNQERFEACAKLIRSRDPGKEGARLVLVEGETRLNAAAKLGITGEAISKAARRIIEADAIIREAYGISYSDDELREIKMSREEIAVLSMIRTHFASGKKKIAVGTIVGKEVYGATELKPKTINSFTRHRFWEAAGKRGFALQEHCIRWLEITK